MPDWEMIATEAELSFQGFKVGRTEWVHNLRHSPRSHRQVNNLCGPELHIEWEV